VSRIEEACAIAKEVGLKYVYIGNVPGHPRESTYCPACGKLLIQRAGYFVLENNVKDGRCDSCGYKIAGIWES
jgi:pyruvate formate lyase activating enzyme